MTSPKTLAERIKAILKATTPPYYTPSERWKDITSLLSSFEREAKKEAFEQYCEIVCPTCKIGYRVEKNRFGVWIHTDNENFPCNGHEIRQAAGGAVKPIHYFILVIMVGFLISNWPTALRHFFWNPKVAITSWNHTPIKIHGHWHQEVDEETGFLYAAPGWCGQDIDCEEGK